jgi:mono/diheme cytochrome c family protein
VTTRLVLPLFLALPAALALPSPQVPDEEREVRLLVGQRSFENNCLFCHSAELTRQNVLTSEQWTAEINKMIDWGAPVPDEERPLLHEFLVLKYGSAAGRAESDRVAASPGLKDLPPLVPLPATIDRARGRRLYEQHCLNCHGSEGQGGDPGSNLIEQPILLDPVRFAAAVDDGRGKMPSFDGVVGASESDEILSWLRGQRYRPFEGKAGDR